MLKIEKTVIYSDYVLDYDYESDGKGYISLS